MIEREVCLALLRFTFSDLLAKVCDACLRCIGRFATSLLLIGAACLALAMLFGGLSFELLLPVLQIGLIDTILNKLSCNGNYTIDIIECEVSASLTCSYGSFVPLSPYKEESRTRL